MITEAILNFLHGIAVSLFTWCKNELPNAPGWIADMSDALDKAFSVVPASVAYFVPIRPTVTIGLALFGIVVAAGLIRLARRVLSIFTGGGGNA